MIIDKVSLFWTKEDTEKIKEIDRSIKTLYEEAHYIDGLMDISENEKLEDLYEEREKVQDAVKDRYFKSFASDPTGLYKEIEDIVEAIEKEDYLAHIKELEEDLVRIYGEEPTLSQSTASFFEEARQENWHNARSFIRSCIIPQIEALVYYKLDVNRANTSAEAKASLWYPQTPAYLPLAHGKVTDAFAYMNSKGALIDPITKNATIEKDSVKLTISNFIDKKTALGIGADKLLTSATAIFTQHNDFNSSSDIKRGVSFSLKEYAEQLGKDVTEHKKPTPEEQQEEKKRVKQILDNVRKGVKKDLDLLQASTLEWKDKKNDNYLKVSFIEATGINNGIVNILFTPTYAEYLLRTNLITQYPIRLLQIDERSPNTYLIGRKIALHYNIDSNQRRGTHTKLSVEALLKESQLPTYEEVQAKDRGHWERKIKNPLEEALDNLVRAGIISDWKYTHAKGVDLTDEEAYNISSYQDFIKLYVEFTINNAVDHTQRIRKKDAEKKKNNRNKRKKRG